MSAAVILKKNHRDLPLVNSLCCLCLVIKNSSIRILKSWRVVRIKRYPISSAGPTITQS